MCYVVSFALIILSTITLMLGLNVIIYDDINQINNRHYLVLCGASSIWSFCHGTIGLIEDIRLASFIRCIAFIGVLVLLARAIVLTSIWMNVNEQIQRVIYIYVTIASLIVYPMIIERTSLIPVHSAFGYYYTFKHYIGRSAFNIYLISIAAIAGALIIYGYFYSGIKRQKMMAKVTFLAGLLLILGTLCDVVFPLFGVASFPSSAFTQAFAVILVYFVSIRYNVSRVTVANVGEYIYSVIKTPVFILDTEEQIQLVNASATEFLGLPTDQIIGKSIEDFFSLYETKQMAVNTDELDRETQNLFIDCKINGAKCDMSVNIILDRYRERLGKIVVVTDMTDKMKMIHELNESRQDAVQANNAKSAFLANMSHEIRTPMNTIVGMSELLLNKEIDEELKQNIMAIRNAGNGLLHIINDVLDISKIESGKFEIIENEYMLASLIVDIANMMGVRLVDKNLYFLVKVDSRLPAKLIGDDIRIKQILINIVGNAVKFTNKGYIQVSISGKYINGQYINLTVEVKDTGIGIPEQELPKLFGIFNQVDTRKNRKITGTGLGLAISKNLAEQMGGTITVDSVYGKGTTFTVKLKQKIADTQKIAQVDKKEKLCIVVYEKEELLIEYFTKTFDELGIHYFVCTNLEELPLLTNMSHFLIRYEYYSQLEEQIGKYVEKSKIITVKRTDENYKEKDTDVLVIFLPLFCFQIINILNNDMNRTLYTKTAFDIRRIKPMQYASVLIVDDNETNLYVAKGLMSSYKMKIDTALSGYDALILVKKKKYDLIFMDHMMPGLDGIDTTKKIRAMEGEYYKTVPIVALTANAMSGARENFISQGFDDFLAKPMEYKELDRILREFILPKKPADYVADVPEKDETEKTVLSPIKDTIPGVDMKEKINSFGGNVQLYMNVLKTFDQDIKKRKDEIISLFEKKDITNFTICIHAIKSACYNVGANRLGKLAELLEQAGKEKDYNWIKQNFNEFIEEMVEIAMAVDEYLQQIDKNVLVEFKTEKAELTVKTMEKIKQLCEDMDIIGLEKELNRLDEYSYSEEESKVLHQMMDAYDEFEYERIEEIVNDFL